MHVFCILLLLRRTFNEYNLIQLGDMNSLSDGRQRLFVDGGIKSECGKTRRKAGRETEKEDGARKGLKSLQ